MKLAENVGLQEYKKNILVDARVFGKNGEMDIIKIPTTVRFFKTCAKSKTRYSFDAIRNAKNDKERLKAILYRAEMSLKKNHCICQNGAVFIGVQQL